MFALETASPLLQSVWSV